MRIIFTLIIFIGINTICFSQVKYDFESGSARMENVVQVSNIQRDELYNKSRIWLAQNLKSSDNQVFLEDTNKENLIATGNLLLDRKGLLSDRVLNFKLSLAFKDGRYKYVIDKIVFSEKFTNIDGKVSYYTYDLDQHYAKMHSKNKDKKGNKFEEIDAELITLMTNLEKTLNNTMPAKSQDW
ncbi:DUF4468 domain-containing protein [Adhaeribacter sp. BT258]|uniref:DUF4468 domain-containing protein n=1 Tax=Adhaeribacter terrigena TaxID=2793070 RepID=A0ABS1BZE7_9BACT|nr:DUF4468 domain-containing protein [Adhaeribacter terrigena]MBK0402292.1 DUF4468 domain-containing protein [Adhaeribacter terrigena]